MFDYRYHALSLAAVLFALALGVLIGVAIGDSNILSSAKSGVVHSLKAELGQAEAREGRLQEELSQSEAFASGVYPLAVHEVLSGRNVGLVFLGSSSDTVNSLARSAVSHAGASLALVAAVREPLDLVAIARQAAGTRFAELAGSAALVGRFGEIAGRDLVGGRPSVGRSLLARVSSSLLSAFDGQLRRLDGVIVVRAQPGGMTAAESQVSAAFESGLLAGVSAAGVTAVGVQLTGTAPSQVPWYRARGISSVDDLETLAGQTALAYALAGEHGSFGVSSGSQSLLPGAQAGA